MSKSDLSARKFFFKFFFWNLRFWTSDVRKNIPKKILSRKGPLGHFFESLFFDFRLVKYFLDLQKNENILPASILLDFYHTASSWDASVLNVTMWQSDSHRLTQEEAATGFPPAAPHTFPKNEKSESLRVSGNHKIILQGEPPE